MLFTIDIKKSKRYSSSYYTLANYYCKVLCFMLYVNYLNPFNVSRNRYFP